jgi:hypothetical protein
MRTAFAPEIAKEKARLDIFSKVGHPGNAAPPIPQARVPAPPPKRNGAPMAASFDVPEELPDDEGEEMTGEATMISSSPFDAMQEAGGAPPSGNEELNEQPTQIFFTAEEVQDVNEPAPPMKPPAGSLGMPAPMPRPGAPGRSSSPRACSRSACRDQR